jgi:uncharacterized membrane protein YkvA (DUF1232 family)
MGSQSFRLSFSLDEHDIAYFRARFRSAKRAAKGADPERILEAARSLVRQIQATANLPSFVASAVASLEDLAEVIEDSEYRPPKSVSSRVLAALAYFADPDDLIPDEIPVLGFLDDAIMIKFVEREFRHELAAYRKFRRFRKGAEQRPWTQVARKRMPSRLAGMRQKLRAEVTRREAADREKGLPRFS